MTKELKRLCWDCEEVSTVDVSFQPYDAHSGLECWDCPLCGYTNEQEVFNEPDPDDARNRRLEREWDEGR